MAERFSMCSAVGQAATISKHLVKDAKDENGGAGGVSNWDEL